MQKFDPANSYGTVTSSEHGICYWQNGLHYNTTFDVVDHMTGRILQRGDHDEASEPDLDLAAWARGAQKINWFKVKKELERLEYDPMPETAEDARAAILAREPA